MTVNHILSIPTSSAEQGALAPRCLPLPALCDAYTSVIFLLQKYEWSSSAIVGSRVIVWNISWHEVYFLLSTSIWNVIVVTGPLVHQLERQVLFFGTSADLYYVLNGSFCWLCMLLRVTIADLTSELYRSGPVFSSSFVDLWISTTQLELNMKIWRVLWIVMVDCTSGCRCIITPFYIRPVNRIQ